MNELQIFKNDDFGEVRGIIIDNEPWFVGKDVCEIFGDTNYRRSLSNIDLEDKGVSQIKTAGGKQNMTIINESGLYSLLFQMQPQKAKGVSQNERAINDRIEKLRKFKHWVTSEVLPSIRKHGAYITDDTIDKVINDPDFGIRLLTELKAERDKRKILEIKAESQQKEITEMKPKADYHDNVLNKADLITTTVIAKDLGLSSAAKLNEILHKNKIIFKSQSGTWCPYSNYEWLIEEEYCDYKSYEDKHTKPCLKWTEKGRKWILENYHKWVKHCA